MSRPNTTNEDRDRSFNATIEAHFRAMGATDNVGHLSNMYPLRLATRAGDLLVGMNGTWVAMRFVDVECAKHVLPYSHRDRFNPHSGKYNVHFSDGTLEDLEFVKQTINTMLEPVR